MLLENEQECGDLMELLSSEADAPENSTDTAPIEEILVDVPGKEGS